jgi:hypothetical protein
MFCALFMTVAFMVFWFGPKYLENRRVASRIAEVSPQIHVSDQYYFGYRYPYCVFSTYRAVVNRANLEIIPWESGTKNLPNISFGKQWLSTASLSDVMASIDNNSAWPVSDTLNYAQKCGRSDDEIQKIVYVPDVLVTFDNVGMELMVLVRGPTDTLYYLRRDI